MCRQHIINDIIEPNDARPGIARWERKSEQLVSKSFGLAFHVRPYGGYDGLVKGPFA